MIFSTILFMAVRTKYEFHMTNIVSNRKDNQSYFWKYGFIFKWCSLIIEALEVSNLPKVCSFLERVVQPFDVSSNGAAREQRGRVKSGKERMIGIVKRKKGLAWSKNNHRFHAHVRQKLSTDALFCAWNTIFSFCVLSMPFCAGWRSPELLEKLFGWALVVSLYQPFTQWVLA